MCTPAVLEATSLDTTGSGGLLRAVSVPVPPPALSVLAQFTGTGLQRHGLQRHDYKGHNDIGHNYIGLAAETWSTEEGLQMP